MKILVFSDFHGLFGFKNHFIEVKQKIKSYNPDIVIFCGDFRNKAEIKTLERRIKNLKLPVYYVLGNDDELSAEFNLKYGINLNLKLEQLSKDLFITGIGGDEYDVKWNIKDLDSLLAKNKSKIRNLVIISHVPPYSICDRSNDGRNCGVKELFELILKVRPNIVLFGHIHENWLEFTCIDRIIFQNVGPNGILIEYINGKFVIDRDLI
ncbi:MAG: metallophosphoesterase family protein [Candidatus Helarchaeota archaeon]